MYLREQRITCNYWISFYGRNDIGSRQGIKLQNRHVQAFRILRKFIQFECYVVLQRIYRQDSQHFRLLDNRRRLRMASVHQYSEQ